jgi:Mn-dependent DtxR family transcriptional regulator
MAGDGNEMKKQESMENYLETIYMISQSGEPVRSIDVVRELDYTKASVSVAMKNLRESGHIVIDSGGYISLTESGSEIARSMYDRHTLLSDWLIFLGVEKETAVSDACKIEHNMSEQSFIAIKNHITDWKRDMYKRKSEKR